MKLEHPLIGIVIRKCVFLNCANKVKGKMKKKRIRYKCSICDEDHLFTITIQESVGRGM